jgi:glyoxylase-like metal-dependent hydrolase (beta-lactamase superfamily II)/ferredoxin
MTRLAQRRPENVTGDLFVDDTCIDCDTCRWMAPDIFNRAGDQSAVFHQPVSEDERLRAMQALLSCPTHSIATVEKPRDIQQAQRSLPIPITDSVFHCGYHSEDSYGAASYFIQRPEGNVLVDSPRFAPPLVKRLEELGGVKYMYLTHRDDVADHAKFQQHFGCDRILHADDITTDTRDVERPIRGNEPFKLADDLEIIPVPGHSRGHTVLLYDNRVLFTGDHLAWSVRLNQLYAFRAYCWYSWPLQIQSMKRLLDYSFEWVLPGHGRRFQADAQTMRRMLEQCIDWMQQQA